MIKNCIICGKPFEAKQQNYKLCSDECRHTRKIVLLKKCYQYRNTDAYRQRCREYDRKRAKIVLCKICGEPVPPVIYGDRVLRKRMHEMCVVNEAVQLAKDGVPFTDARFKRAKNMGYTARELKEILRGEC